MKFHEILLTKTQLEGTSPQVDNRVSLCVRGKFGGSSEKKKSSGKLNVFLFFAREASKLSLAKRAGVFAREVSKLASDSGGWEVAREASGVCEGKKKTRDKP